MINGQVSLELLVAVLVMVSILTLLVGNQNQQSLNLAGIAQNLETKIQADIIGTYCNLFYFNRYNIELETGFSMDQEIEKDVECFGSPIAWYGERFRISSGIRRW